MIRDISTVILNSVTHPSGTFKIRSEKWFVRGEGEKIMMDRAYTMDGLYIGPVHMASTLLVKMGIPRLEKITPNDFECAIGFHPVEQRWYGWTVEAIKGFKVGDTVLDETVPFEDPEEEYKDVEVKTHKIKTLEEAKELAIAYVRELESR